MQYGSLLCRATLLAGAMVALPGSAASTANPVAPWHEPRTPQSYHPEQKWGTDCQPDAKQLERLQKRAGSKLKPERADDGTLTFNALKILVKHYLGTRSTGRADYAQVEVDGSKRSYAVVVSTRFSSFSSFRSPSFNGKSLDIPVDGKMRSFPAGENATQSSGCTRQPTGFESCSAESSTRFEIDEALVDYVAGQPDAKLLPATFWMTNGTALGCPILLNPVEFRMIKEAGRNG